MNVVETQWWTLALPPEWWADSEEDGILVGDRDDVGCIEISTLHKEKGDFDSDTVMAIAQEDSEQPLEWQPACLVSSLAPAVVMWRRRRRFVSGMCQTALCCCSSPTAAKEENRGMDDAAVDEILDTLMLAGNGP